MPRHLDRIVGHQSTEMSVLNLEMTSNGLPVLQPLNLQTKAGILFTQRQEFTAFGHHVFRSIEWTSDDVQDRRGNVRYVNACTFKCLRIGSADDHERQRAGQAQQEDTPLREGPQRLRGSCLRSLCAICHGSYSPRYYPTRSPYCFPRGLTSRVPEQTA